MSPAGTWHGPSVGVNPTEAFAAGPVQLGCVDVHGASQAEDRVAVS